MNDEVSSNDFTHVQGRVAKQKVAKSPRSHVTPDINNHSFNAITCMMIALTLKWQNVSFDFFEKILITNMKKEDGKAQGHTDY